jgi:hypothetical protein
MLQRGRSFLHDGDRESVDEGENARARRRNDEINNDKGFLSLAWSLCCNHCHCPSISWFFRETSQANELQVTEDLMGRREGDRNREGDRESDRSLSEIESRGESDIFGRNRLMVRDDSDFEMDISDFERQVMREREKGQQRQLQEQQRNSWRRSVDRYQLAQMSLELLRQQSEQLK